MITLQFNTKHLHFSCTKATINMKIKPRTPVSFQRIKTTIWRWCKKFIYSSFQSTHNFCRKAKVESSFDSPLGQRKKKQKPHRSMNTHIRPSEQLLGLEYVDVYITSWSCPHLVCERHQDFFFGVCFAVILLITLPLSLSFWYMCTLKFTSVHAPTFS